MSNAIFPTTLKGIGFPVGRKPVFSTIVSKTVNGNEIRIQNYPFALEEFSLPLNYAKANAALWTANGSDYQAIDGFFRQRSGPWDSFLYLDPADFSTTQNASYAGQSPITGQNIIGTGTGSQTAFQFYRSIGGALQPIYNINGITATSGSPPAVTVYVNGSLVSTGWTMSAAGMLTFSTAPTSGYTIAVDCQYFKRVRFSEDAIDFEQFMSNLWRAKKIPMQVVYA